MKNNTLLLKELMNEVKDECDLIYLYWSWKFLVEKNGTVDDRTTSSYMIKIIMFLLRFPKSYWVRLPINCAYEKMYFASLLDQGLVGEITTARRSDGYVDIEVSPIRFLKSLRTLDKINFIFLCVFYFITLLAIGFQNFRKIFLRQNYEKLVQIINIGLLDQITGFRHQGDYPSIVKAISLWCLKNNKPVTYLAHGAVYDPLAQFVLYTQIQTVNNKVDQMCRQMTSLCSYSETKIDEYHHSFTMTPISLSNVRNRTVELYLQGFDWTSVSQSILRVASVIKILSRQNNCIILKFHPTDGPLIRCYYNLLNLLYKSTSQTENNTANLTLSFYSSILSEIRDSQLIKSGSLLFCDSIDCGR